MSWVELNLLLLFNCMPASKIEVLAEIKHPEGLKFRGLKFRLEHKRLPVHRIIPAQVAAARFLFFWRGRLGGGGVGLFSRAGCCVLGWGASFYVWLLLHFSAIRL